MSCCRLRDPASEVRQGTMLVLTNLIMNDMVKVKGQISEMALCIVDTEEKLAGKSLLHNIRQYEHDSGCCLETVWKLCSLFNILTLSLAFM